MSQIVDFPRPRNEDFLPVLLILALQLTNCQSDLVTDEKKNGSGQPSGGAGGTSTPGSISGGTGPISLPDGGEGTLVLPVYAEAGVCANQDAEAKLLPVHLVFAFDVSSSMGKLDEPYHNPKLNSPATPSTSSLSNPYRTPGYRIQAIQQPVWQ